MSNTRIALLVDSLAQSLRQVRQEVSDTLRGLDYECNEIMKEAMGPAAAVEGTGELTPSEKANREAATRNEIANFHNSESANFLKRLRTDRGAIVSSADCSEMEIVFARKENRWYVDEDGMGYVIRMKEWREESERLIRDRCEARDVSDSPAEPAPAPPAEWKVVQRKDTAEWIVEIAGPKLATQAEAEAAAAKVNGTCHHISTLQREHKQMAAEISRLQTELAASEREHLELRERLNGDGDLDRLESDERDIQAMELVRSQFIDLVCYPNQPDKYHAHKALRCCNGSDPADAILDLAAELDKVKK